MLSFLLDYLKETRVYINSILTQTRIETLTNGMATSLFKFPTLLISVVFVTRKVNLNNDNKYVYLVKQNFPLNDLYNKQNR